MSKSFDKQVVDTKASGKPLYAYVTASYGPLRVETPYRIKETGRDFYVFSNGTHVPKNLVTFSPPKKKNIEQDVRFDEWET